MHKVIGLTNTILLIGVQNEMSVYIFITNKNEKLL